MLAYFCVLIEAFFLCISLDTELKNNKVFDSHFISAPS